MEQPKRPGIVTVRLTSRWPYNPISLAVGVAAGSRQFSHSITVIGERAYEASMTHGCRAGAVDQLMRGIVIYRDMPVVVPDIDAALAFAEAQMGKGYDFAGAVGIPLTYSEDWTDDSKWWCSDLTFAILLAGGLRIFDPAVMKRVRPIDLHMADYPKSQLMRA
ncbi:MULTISPECIES: hypothetical protein [Massilia]|uniref:Uncharacterized protein n=1 Tax=Massilia haematophila TaxID=457923 RepID=A0ABV7PDN1_9BURK|nr:hypothetical protein [Massilia sp.]